MLSIFILILTFLASAQEILGKCPSSAACKIQAENYIQMCSCDASKPSYCTRNNECRSCILVNDSCNAKFNVCCQISDGRSFCDTKTGKCEMIRYCDPSSKCAYDDLTSTEIQLATVVIKDSGKFSSDIEFPIVRTQEPSKLTWNSGMYNNQRIAYVAVFDNNKHILSEVLVDLKLKKLIKITQRKNTIPPMTDGEVLRAHAIVLSDPRVISAYEKRGLNISNARFEPWAVGASGSFVNSPGKRLINEVSYYKDPLTKHYYWAPVEGLFINVDSNKNAVDQFDDIETVPLAPVYQILESNSYNPPLKPLLISQPQGSSIKVAGQYVTWYKWKLRYSMDPIHGLQLFQVRYNADCEDRPVLHKISIGDLQIPYGAKGKAWRIKSAFDAGEYGLGLNALPLTIGKELPENALQFDCAFANSSSGAPYTLPNCVGMYEEDTQILYTHSEFGNGKSDKRRGRVMVLTFFLRIGNYEYGFDYVFHMDGIIQIRVRLTGIVLPRGDKRRFNNKKCIEDCDQFVNDYLVGASHQHFFNYRMDFDVDGTNNYVTEVDVTNDKFDPIENPDGGAFSPKSKILKKETYRDYNVESSRSWQVLNANSRNRFNSPRCYMIKPMDIAYTHIHKGDPHLPQVEFIKHPFWVTKYKDDEQAPGGDFPRSGQPYKGLPQFIKDKESITDTDVVAWYTVGITHIPRSEQWPIMDVETVGFLLVPFNFMSQNSEIPLKEMCP